jgi:hypothetical protein
MSGGRELPLERPQISKVCSQGCAVLLEMAIAVAMESAVDDLLRSAGLLCRAMLIISATLSSFSIRGRHGLGSLCKPSKAEIPVAFAVMAHGHSRHAHPLGHDCVGLSGFASQNNQRPFPNQMGKRLCVGNALESLNLVVAENKRNGSGAISSKDRQIQTVCI